MIQTVLSCVSIIVPLSIDTESELTLDINAPSIRLEAESFQSTFLAQSLGLVDVLVTSVVSGSGVSLRVLVLHDTAQSLEHRLGCEVLRGNEVDEVLLPLLLLYWESALYLIAQDGLHLHA